MSIRRVSLGGGFRYLMGSVAAGDGHPHPSGGLAAYYSASGTPPGRFLGAGLADLGGGRGVAEGTEVTEAHLINMLGLMCDPVTGEPVGRSPNLSDVRRPVAGFDLTFSPPKSVSTMWAMADPETKDLIYGCHRRAVYSVIAYAEESVFKSRSGVAGRVEEDLTGVVATAFTHWDSRAGDPQLHDHVVVWNRARSVSDGKWRTLDSRGLFKAAVALSKLHQGLLADELTRTLGVGWEARARRHSDRARWEIEGVPEPLMSEFSQRAAQIETHKDDLVAEFVAAHRRQPSDVEILKLRQTATLATRPNKTLQSLADMTTSWRDRATPHLGPRPEQLGWASDLRGRNQLPVQTTGDLDPAMLSDAAGRVLDAVSERKATFSRHNILGEAAEVLDGVRFASAADRIAAIEQLAGLALDNALLISAPQLEPTPEVYLRADGTSRLDPANHQIFTTRAILDAEGRLLDALDDHTAPAASTPPPAPVAQGATRPLSEEQAAAVAQILASRRRLDVLVGPAGTGKTTAMTALKTVWERTYGSGSVIGLAPSAAAAEVLADEVGIGCENTAKWLTEQARLPALEHRHRQAIEALARHPWPTSPSATPLRQQAQTISTAIDQRRLHPGQLVIVDEASMAGTRTLDHLVVAANHAGAKVLLVGDWAQLSSVEAGGAFGLLARTLGDDAPHLGEVHRFANEWERHASLQLRSGNPKAIDTYGARGRLAEGDRDQLIDEMYLAWKHDVDAGRISLMIAADTATVDQLNGRARSDLITAGLVASSGVPAAGNQHVSVGDRIVTRRNDRQLSDRQGRWIRNGDTWTVTETAPDGSVTARHTITGDHARLPASYVRSHVDLAYATTAHRAQGRTVDTSHALITPASSRPALYVAVTRGRDANHLYIDTHWDPDPDTSHAPQEASDPHHVLRRILAAEDHDSAAHDVIRRNDPTAANVTAPDRPDPVPSGPGLIAHLE